MPIHQRATTGTSPQTMNKQCSLSSSSADTVEFTESELEAGLRRVNAHLEPSIAYPGSVRILLIPSANPISFDVVPHGITSKRHSFILDTNGSHSSNTVKYFAITQSSHDIGCVVEAFTLKPERKKVLACQIYFDPRQDRMIAVNLLTENVVMRSSTTEISVESYHPTPLDPGVYYVFLSNGLHTFNLQLFHRQRHESQEARIQSKAEVDQVSTRKRHFQSSQGDPNKGKQRVIGGSIGSVFVLSTAARIASCPESGVDYTLTRGKDIAANGASSVYTASHSMFPGKTIVVKVIKTAKNSSDAVDPEKVISAAELWLREVKIHSQLSHPAVLRLFEADARFLTLYLEHIDAPDLGACRDAPSDYCNLNESDAKRIFIDTSTALLYIHSQGFVHNDMKAANILYTPHRGALVIDFGLAVSAADAKATGGTPGYLPPEYLSNRLQGRAGDVWALGIVMLYVLGRVPLPERSTYWVIPHLGSRKDKEREKARSSMKSWLQRVSKTRSQLGNESSTLTGLVWEMLEPDLSHRIGLSQLVEDLNLL
ncbi:kinase-like domain-containing protein [Xylariaceae sp. FL0016]|nr:kinase-like domain-containing protein [Xylariaceae sp. FL0016]